MKKPLLTIVIVSFIGGSAFQWARSERKPLHLEAPDNYVSLQNPFAEDAEARQMGERIYFSKCAKCHEPKDDRSSEGPSLDTPEIKAAPAGSLYWVLEKGDQRKGMPSFAKLPEKYRWHVITFLQWKKR